MKLQENNVYIVVNKENYIYFKAMYISTEVNIDEIHLVFKHSKTKEIITIYDLNVIEIYSVNQAIDTDLTKYAEY